MDLAIGVENLLSQLEYSESKTGCLETGFKTFDKEYGGLVEGGITVIGGRIQMGLTDFCTSLINNVSIQNKIPSTYITLDSIEDDIRNRLISSHLTINRYRLNRLDLKKKDVKKIKYSVPEIKKFPITIYDDVLPKPIALLNKIQEVIKDDKPKLFILDDLNQIESGDKSFNNFLDDIKNIATKTNVSFVLSYHINNEVEKRGGDKRPLLFDLNPRYYLRKISDMIIYIYRPEYYGLDEDVKGQSTKNLAELLVRKSSSGKVGTVNLKYNRKYCSYKNIES
ncbi:DnaB-like helicase C-terminal domain-containing protein [Bacteroidota bacterium]